MVVKERLIEVLGADMDVSQPENVVACRWREHIHLNPQSAIE